MYVLDVEDWLAQRAAEGDEERGLLTYAEALLYLDYAQSAQGTIYWGSAIIDPGSDYGNYRPDDWTYALAKGAHFEEGVRESCALARANVDFYLGQLGEGVEFNFGVRAAPIRLALQEVGFEVVASCPEHLASDAIALDCIGLPGAATPILSLAPLVKWIEDEHLIFVGADKYSGTTADDLRFERIDWLYAPRYGRYHSYAAWESYEEALRYLNLMALSRESGILLDLIVVDSFEKLTAIGIA